MMRIPALAAAILAVAIGAWFRPSAPNRVADMPGGDAAAWGTENGLTLERSEKLTASGIYVVHRYAGAGNCRLTVVPLGNADEIMPRLQDLKTDQGAADRFLLLNALGPMPATTMGVTVRRLLARVRDGHVTQPVMVVAGPECALTMTRSSLTAWPTP
nr:hypothetical protein [uncultured Rhodopila sp.]